MPDASVGREVLGHNGPKKCEAVSIPVTGTPLMGECWQHTRVGYEGHEGKHNCPDCGQDW